MFRLGLGAVTAARSRDCKSKRDDTSPSQPTAASTHPLTMPRADSPSAFRQRAAGTPAGLSDCRPDPKWVSWCPASVWCPRIPRRRSLRWHLPLSPSSRSHVHLWQLAAPCEPDARRPLQSGRSRCGGQDPGGHEVVVGECVS